MGTKSIDVMQTQHIALLEADMLEMKNKLNSLITEVSALSDKIGLNYTPATSGSSHGSSTDSVLLRLERLDTDLQNLETKISNHIGTGGSPLTDAYGTMFWAATSNTGALSVKTLELNEVFFISFLLCYQFLNELFQHGL